MVNNRTDLNCYTNMIKNLVDLLNISDYYNVSENVEIAKGKYELPNGWKEALTKIKRHGKSSKGITWKDIWNKIKRLKWQIKK